MSESSNNKPYYLVEWTLLFAKDIRLFIKTLKMTICQMKKE